jgi:mono/diheme cytochrome c family protein
MRWLAVPFFAGLCALALVPSAEGNGCRVTYSAPSYSYSYPSYSYSYPVYQEYKAPAVSYVPVATYYPVPVPLYLAGAMKDYMGMSDKKAMPADSTKEILDAINKVGTRVDLINSRVDDLDRRMRALEVRGPTPPPGPADPFAPGRLPAPEKAPAPKKETSAETMPQMFHAACAACHDQKVAKDKGGSFVMFVTQFDGIVAVSAEMGPKPGETLSVAALKKMHARLTTKDVKKVMPPATDAEGKALQALPPERRAQMAAWLQEQAGAASLPPAK